MGLLAARMSTSPLPITKSRLGKFQIQLEMKMLNQTLFNAFWHLDYSNQAIPQHRGVCVCVCFAQDSDSNETKFWGSLVNALIFVAIVVVMTFVLVLLFKYGVSAKGSHSHKCGLKENASIFHPAGFDAESD